MILLASPQGSGKSVSTDKIAAELARHGYVVLISVPTGELALEHQKRIKDNGSHAFVVLSHRNIFLLMNPGFDCPEFEPIQEYIKFGLNSSQIKQKFCSKCPYESQCPYPFQYKEVQEPIHKIVIIQHAHYAAEDAMANLLKKHFDALFIDEALFDYLIGELMPLEIEYKLLESVADQVGWAERLADWLRDGGYPDTRKIRQTVEEMQGLEGLFLANEAPFRIADWIRHFNEQRYLDPLVGLHVFHPVPKDRIPVIAITDATPPLKMYEIIFNETNIKILGEDEILDYRAMNPENRVIQVLDTSMSKTSMRGSKNAEGEYEYIRLIEWLEFVGDQARNVYTNEKILITTYVEFERLCRRWIEKNYPDVMNRITVGHMSIGTNKFEDCDVQYLLAGVYLSAKEIYKQVYRLKLVANYWNLKNDLPVIPNMYHSGVGTDAAIDRGLEPVHRVSLGKSSDGVDEAQLVQYDQFMCWPPIDAFHKLIETFMIARTQQALRLRYNNSSKRVTYIAGNFRLPSFLITDSVLESELIGYLRDS